MKIVLLSQRVDVIQSYNERRDCLDQAFYKFIKECGYLPISIANDTTIAQQMLSQLDISAIVLTGGNDLASYGGNAPERDEMETMLVNFAMQNNIPLLGVCRGAQVLNCFFGGSLEKITGHVAVRHNINYDGNIYDVNSFHNFGLANIPTCFDIKAQTSDGVVKAIKHKNYNIMGIMWHPEREGKVTELDERILKLLIEE